MEKLMQVMVLLSDAHVRLNQLNAQPGPHCHMLASSIRFYERLMSEIAMPKRLIIKSDGPIEKLRS